MNESLKQIVAGLNSHVRNALETYVEHYTPALAAERMKARAHIEGYLLAARNSGNLCVSHCDRLLDEIKTADGYRIIAACFEPVKPPITAGERSLYRYKFNECGGFEHSLWEAIFKADLGNLALLRKAFPEHVHARDNFANQRGWWDALVCRIKAGE